MGRGGVGPLDPRDDTQAADPGVVTRRRDPGPINPTGRSSGERGLSPPSCDTDSVAERPLWTCPNCGRRFVTANLWHSCYVGTLDDFFADHQHLRPIFDAYVRFVEDIGPFTVEVVRTRISFATRARFAGVVRLRRDGLVAGFWLKRSVSSERFIRVEHIERDDWVYQLLLRSEADLDDELRGWLEEAYLVGQQQR